MIVDKDQIAALPTVLLHDHLDGGLRPATVVELAAQTGQVLPTTDPEELGRWFTREAVLTLVSEQSIVEGGTSNIIRPETTLGDRE